MKTFESHMKLFGVSVDFPGRPYPDERQFRNVRVRVQLIDDADPQKNDGTLTIEFRMHIDDAMPVVDAERNAMEVAAQHMIKAGETIIKSPASGLLRPKTASQRFG
ncbi:hypothetical protein [Pannonibacter sp. SL95]|uniref:hypothetical protein n=1 Tax=Pannonibacter sp. SL95 TaxID=2995153 RepID=UPI002275FEAB|nr:hypothetical protein [Pannonibacter sp. SL95]MCY1704414.1 hypothetical protein [Pannonibacter sp. SL95]MCY1706458.1 hypothetical protein [Pannonibacter sp. SL95]MCY1707355.1 hypothetical protein [Pannonibacter sp. SL95]